MSEPARDPLAALEALEDSCAEAVALDAIADWDRGWRQAHRKMGRDLRAAITEAREALPKTEPCNRCGQRPVINERPGVDIVVCEPCAYAEGRGA